MLRRLIDVVFMFYLSNCIKFKNYYLIFFKKKLINFSHKKNNKFFNCLINLVLPILNNKNKPFHYN